MFKKYDYTKLNNKVIFHYIYSYLPYLREIKILIDYTSNHSALNFF